MGNTHESAKFRGLVQVLGERHLNDSSEIEVLKSEFWTLKLESPDDFFSKFSAQDARDIVETGNAFFLIEESLERMTQSKTACRVLQRLFPVFFASQMSLPSPALLGPSILSLLCEDKICFEDEKDDDDHDVLWSDYLTTTTVRRPTKFKDSHALDENRIEVLRLLVIALSEPLFNKSASAGEVITYVFDGLLDSTFQEESISEKGTNLFLSMFAVVCENTRKELAQHCCTALCALLDLPAGESNPLLYVWRNFPRPPVFAALAKRIDEEKCLSISSLCLLWRLLDASQNEEDAMTDETRCSLVFSLSSAMFTNRKLSRTRHSTVQLTTILLFLLSCDRKTGIAVNRPLGKVALPKDFQQTSAEWTVLDFLVTAVQRFVMEGDPLLFEPLQRLSMTCLVNLSWYMRSLNFSVSANLMVLLEKLKKKRFLLGKDTNHLYLKSLLEIITNVLQYQSQGNSRLLYSMLRSRHLFFDLSTMTLAQEEPMVPTPTEDATIVKQEEETKVTEPAALVVEEPAVFTPSPEWFEDCKSKFALSVPLFAIKELAGKMDQIVSSDERDYLTVIEQTTLVGALPAPQPIVISKYSRTEKIDAVIRRCFWMDLYRGDDYLDLWQVPVNKTERGTRPREDSV